MKSIFFALFLPIFLFPCILYCQIDVHDITTDSSVTFKAGNYRAGKFKQFLLGSHYRDVWEAPVSALVFDLQKSGLKVTKQGGSRQTINLRLEDTAGNEYVLRSIDKHPSRALPERLRSTFISGIMEDQTATGHPYGALTIPTMASAIGVYHTNPILVYVPRDSAFGEFADVLANQPAIFERRPDEDQSHVASFGNPPHVVGTTKMLEHLQKDHTNTVNAVLFARTRLFDMLINDWGRHEDQWRWGIYKTDNGKVFHPIPRDRDHAYFTVDGLIPVIAGKWFIKNLVRFEHCFPDVKGLNKSADELDNRLLSGINKEEWIRQAEHIKDNLNDEIIEQAIQELPPAAFELTGEEIISKLKSRRDQLHDVAYLYYTILAKEVTVTGSDKRELFTVKRLNNDSTEVKVFNLSEDGEIKQLRYCRVFLMNETEAINLIGQGGNDIFELTGEVQKGIVIQITGDEGKDIIKDSSDVKGIKRMTIVTDTDEFEEIYCSPETKLK